MLTLMQRQARTKRLKSRTKPGPKPRLPTTLERRYRVWIKKLVGKFEKQALKELELRTDAVGAETFRRLAVWLSNLLSDQEIAPFLNDLGEQITNFTRRDVSRMLSIDLHSSGELAPQIREFVRTNARLIRKMSFETLDLLEKKVNEATAQQLSVKDLSKIVRDRFDVSRSRAELIARDQTLKLNGQITQTRLQGLGVSEYVWITSRDERVRSDHRALNGRRFSWNDPPVVDRRTGRRAHPGQDYQCRCTASPVIPELDLTGQLG